MSERKPTVRFNNTHRTSRRKSNTPLSLFDDNFFNRIDRYFVGFDNIFRDFDQFFAEAETETYPPYNITRHQTDDNETFIIEMAVAGFNEEHISVKQTDDLLIVKTNVRNYDEEEDHDVDIVIPNGEVLHRGIAFRGFERRFRIPKKSEVEARLESGMLILTIETPKAEVSISKAIPIAT